MHKPYETNERIFIKKALEEYIINLLRIAFAKYLFLLLLTKKYILFISLINFNRA